MAAPIPLLVHGRFERVLAVTAAAWGVSRPSLPVRATRPSRMSRPAQGRPVSRTDGPRAAPFGGLAVSY